MNQLNTIVADRPVVAASKRRPANRDGLELPWRIVTSGETSSLLGPSAARMLKRLKELGGINDEMHLLSPIIIEPIQRLKR